MTQSIGALIFATAGIWLGALALIFHTSRWDTISLRASGLVLLAFALWLYLDAVPRHPAAGLLAPLNLAVLPLGLMLVGRAALSSPPGLIRVSYAVVGLPLCILGLLFGVGYLLQGRG